MKIIFINSATKDVIDIKDESLKNKIREVIINLKRVNSLNGIKGVKKIKGDSSAYRIRLGNYRFGFYCDNYTVIIVRILKRADIYKKFP